jgi:hypothetical protein
VQAKLSHPASGGGTIAWAGPGDRSAEPIEGAVLGEPVRIDSAAIKREQHLDGKWLLRTPTPR